MLYRGDFLSGFRVDETGFEEWLVAERERLRELAIEGLGKVAGPPGGGARDRLRRLRVPVVH
jgi:hypothetical protein